MSETATESTPQIKIQTLQERIDQDIKTIDIAEVYITEKKEELQGLVISGVDDKGTYKLVDTLRKEVKKKISLIEAKRKELNADAISYQRKMNAYCKGLSEPLRDIMNDAAAKTKAIDEENRRIQDEILKQKQLKMQNRIDQLVANNGPIDYIKIQEMSDEEYETHLNNLIASNKAEAKRLEEEARIKAEEDARLAAEAEEKRRIAQEEADRIAAEQQRENERIAEEQRIIREEEDRKAQEKLEAQRLENERIAKEQEEKQERLRLEKEQLEADRQQILADQAEIDKLKQDLSNPAPIEDSPVPPSMEETPNPPVDETNDNIIDPSDNNPSSTVQLGALRQYIDELTLPNPPEIDSPVVSPFLNHINTKFELFKKGILKDFFYHFPVLSDNQD